MLSILVATKNFELFLLVELQQIAKNLKGNTLNNHAEKKLLQRTVEQYKIICWLCEEFNKIFSVQLTFMTCYSTTLFIFRVIDAYIAMIY